MSCFYGNASAIRPKFLAALNAGAASFHLANTVFFEITRQHYSRNVEPETYAGRPSFRGTTTTTTTTWCISPRKTADESTNKNRR